MDKVLLDTDVLSEIFKGKNDPIITHAMEYRSQYGYFTTSLKGTEILAFEREAAKITGRIFGDLERNGQPVGRSDPMIAGIAIAHNLILVTGNLAHYQRIQNLGYPLRLNDWH